MERKKNKLKIEALIHNCKFFMDKMPELFLRRILIFWNLIPFNLLEVYICFEGPFCLYLQGISAIFRKDVG
jgi:hypothetical protein